MRRLLALQLLAPAYRQAAAAKRAFDAMMTMRKIDIAATEAAFRG